MSTRLLVAANLVFSAVLFCFLLWLIYAFKPEEGAAGAWLWLPHFNAACNATSAFAVTLGIIAIRRQRTRAHSIWMILATVASACFLAGYLLHHSISGDTRFTGEGFIRTVYFFILITHVLMSGIALPLILNTLSFAAFRRWPAHRRIARWTYPVWLYVSVTGVAVWFFLRILYPAGA